MSELLSEEERRQALADLPGWTASDEGTAITRDFTFARFADAFAFMTRVAFAAEAMNHHPDWSNSHARVSVRLSTHDAGGLTAKDLKLARIIDAVAARDAR